MHVVVVSAPSLVFFILFCCAVPRCGGRNINVCMHGAWVAINFFVVVVLNGFWRPHEGFEVDNLETGAQPDRCVVAAQPCVRHGRFLLRFRHKGDGCNSETSVHQHVLAA